MRAPSVDTGTALRLARIAALVVGCLLFLHACERTRRVVPTDVWIELAIAAALGAAAMVVAWFEIARAEELDEAEAPEPARDAGPADAPRECRIESDGRTVRARIAKSGNLVLHGHDYTGPHPGHEWSWTFRPAVFPAIRAALGGDSESDLIDLLEDVVLDSRPEIRDDPGAWLRAHGIAAAYREKGDHPSRVTTKLPIFRGMRRLPENESARALPGGRGEDEVPERSARSTSGREPVATRASVTRSRERSPREVSETRQAVRTPDSRRATPVSRRAATATETRRATTIAESRRATNGSETRRTATVAETRRAAEASETRRAAKASDTRRAAKASETHRGTNVAETRQAAKASETHRAAAVSEAVDDRPALPRRERPAERATTGRARQSYEPPRPAGEPASDRPSRDHHPTPKSAPAAAASPSAPDRPVPRMPAAAAAYEAASDRAAPPHHTPAYDAPTSRHSTEPPDRGYPPPPLERRRAHRYR